MRRMRTWSPGAAGAAVLAISLTSAAGAQEYCVACTGPDAVYRCVIDRAAPAEMPLKMLCVTTLAKEGAHATCAVRGGTVFDCNGPIRRVDAMAAGEGLAAPSPVAPASPTAAGPAAAAAKPAVEAQGPASPKAHPPAPQKQTKADNEPPKTVAELAKRVSKSSGESLDQAGSTIAKATSKAWGCLTSFFKSCQ